MAKDGYHHGDLKSALIEAASRAVEQGGAEAVSLRDLAQGLGVSRAAPYRHFADRDALLAAVAARGFEDLIVAYEAALGADGPPEEILRRTGRVYIDFARGRPGLFRLMFDSDFLSRSPPPAVLMGPANRAYELLWQAMEQADPTADRATIRARVITGWSTLYGFISLDRGGRFKDFMIEPLRREDLVDIVLDAAGRPP